MNQPLISIVIPTYNRADLLKLALNSLIKQIYQNWEAIVVDNFSEDGTIDIVNSFFDNRIKLIKFSNKGIIAAARNKGIHYASGQYIAFLDSDDVWYPEKLSVCVKYIDSGFDLLCHNVKFRYKNNGIKKIFVGPKSSATFEKVLYKKNCFVTSAVICRKSLIEQVGGFKVSKIYNTAEDYDLWLRLLKITNNIYFIDEFLGENLIHQGNESAMVEKHIQAILAVTKFHHKSIPQTIFNCIRYNIKYLMLMVSIGLSIIKK